MIGKARLRRSGKRTPAGRGCGEDIVVVAVVSVVVVVVDSF